jgi:hypothetical protein
MRPGFASLASALLRFRPLVENLHAGAKKI